MQTVHPVVSWFILHTKPWKQESLFLTWFVKWLSPVCGFLMLISQTRFQKRTSLQPKNQFLGPIASLWSIWGTNLEKRSLIMFYFLSRMKSQILTLGDVQQWPSFVWTDPRWLWLLQARRRFETRNHGETCSPFSVSDEPETFLWLWRQTDDYCCVRKQKRNRKADLQIQSSKCMKGGQDSSLWFRSNPSGKGTHFGLHKQNAFKFVFHFQNKFYVITPDKMCRHYAINGTMNAPCIPGENCLWVCSNSTAPQWEWFLCLKPTFAFSDEAVMTGGFYLGAQDERLNLTSFYFQQAELNLYGSVTPKTCYPATEGYYGETAGGQVLSTKLKLSPSLLQEKRTTSVLASRENSSN